MKLFKSIDEKFKEMGFTKISEDDYSVIYERKNKYIQTLELHKKGLIFSFDKDLFDTKNIGNTCVGLTCKEIELIIKKMKKKHWY